MQPRHSAAHNAPAHLLSGAGVRQRGLNCRTHGIALIIEAISACLGGSGSIGTKAHAEDCFFCTHDGTVVTNSRLRKVVASTPAMGSGRRRNIGGRKAQDKDVEDGMDNAGAMRDARPHALATSSRDTRAPRAPPPAKDDLHFPSSGFVFSREKTNKTHALHPSLPRNLTNARAPALPRAPRAQIPSTAPTACSKAPSRTTPRLPGPRR